MNNPSDRNDMTPAQRNAHDAFKETSPDPRLSDYEMAQKAIDLNRRRLKSERLAREAADPRRK
jgi:hypothetical protein